MTTFALHLTDFGTAGFSAGLRSELADVVASLDESRAFDTLWLTDHVRYLGPGGPTTAMPEAYTLLSAIAALTRRIRLGVLATSVLYRSPAVLAKVVTTIDVMSGGRAVLGIGSGHPRTAEEHREYGIHFPPVPERMAALDRALDVIGPMLQHEAVAGTPANWPRPVQPRIPVLVAGSGEQLLLRIAARHADLVNFSFPSGDTLDRIEHKRDVLTRHCRTVGRDPGDIAVTYKAMLVVADSADEARALWDAWRIPRGLPASLGAREGVFVGDPAGVRGQLRPWLDLDLEQMIFEMPAADAKAISFADEALADLCGTQVRS